MNALCSPPASQLTPMDFCTPVEPFSLLPGESPAWLVLEDGSVWEGRRFGADKLVSGELVFNTSLTGYQEILTDPSYKGQIVMMTYPEIGNYGVNPEDVESAQVHAAGFVVRQASVLASSWRSAGALDAYLKEADVMGIEGLDTRALTRRIREKGAMKAMMATSPEQVVWCQQVIADQPGLEDQDLVSVVTCREPRLILGAEHGTLVDRLVTIDYGIKANILECLKGVARQIQVLPASATQADVNAFAPDAVFLSNGPGDPRTLTHAAELVQQLMAQQMPLLGICLGHQILSLASGATVEKMAFGHHGGNHPVMDVNTGVIRITSQNHGYAVVEDSLAGVGLKLTHRNLYDGSVEGVAHQTQRLACVQFHPEASPGPHDAQDLFRWFFDEIQGR